MRDEVDTVGRVTLLVFFLMGTFALLSYMELRHEVERITSETALVTNHLTGEVRQCNTRGNGDWSCRPVDMQARHWIFALIPFWPARDHLVNDLHVHTVPADEASFLSPQIVGDMGTYAAFAIVMLVLGFILREKNWRRDASGGGDGGGSDGGGAGDGGA